MRKQGMSVRYSSSSTVIPASDLMGDIVIRRDQGASTGCHRHACGVETVVDRSWFFVFFGGVLSTLLNLSICLEVPESVCWRNGVGLIAKNFRVMRACWGGAIGINQRVRKTVREDLVCIGEIEVRPARTEAG